MSAAWSLTVRGVSVSCLDTASIDDETDAEIGGNNVVVAITVVGAWPTPRPTTGAMLSGKTLESMELLSNNQRNVQLLTLYYYQSLNPCRSTMVWAHATFEEKIYSLWKIQQLCVGECDQTAT